MTYKQYMHLLEGNISQHVTELFFKYRKLSIIRGNEGEEHHRYPKPRLKKNQSKHDIKWI
jgi:hypothetical protein